MTKKEFLNLLQECKTFRILHAKAFLGSEKEIPGCLNILFDLPSGWTMRQVSIEQFKELVLRGLARRKLTRTN
jgi:hypothetical protein